MQKTWKFISNLGTNLPDGKTDRRTIILSNQINFAILCCMVLILIVILTGKAITGNTLNFGALRVVFLLCLNIFNIFLAWYGYTKLSRLSLIFLPHLIFLLGPTLSGYVEEEGFTYYPYVVIGTAIIPQLLLNPVKEKFLYWFSLSYYFILVLMIDKIMILTGTGIYPILDRIKTFYHFYKIAQIGLFLLITSSIYYLQKLGMGYEEELKKKNDELDLQNKELKRQKDELEKKKNELAAKEIDTWQKLVSIISHEIVNSAIPITNLAGMTRQMLEDESAQVLRSGQISDETYSDIHHGLEIIESRTRGLIDFVNATKNISRIPKPNFREVPIRELFDRIGLLFRTKFRDSRVNFTAMITPDNLSVEADLELIEQVIINLIQNSLEAMNGISDPSLTLTAGINSSGGTRIIISDNGPGIPEELAEKIFLPFYSTKSKNSGIGLSLSRQIMLAHNGRLELNPEVKTGASFSIIFQSAAESFKSGF